MMTFEQHSVDCCCDVVLLTLGYESQFWNVKYTMLKILCLFLFEVSVIASTQHLMKFFLDAIIVTSSGPVNIIWELFNILILAVKFAFIGICKF